MAHVGLGRALAAVRAFRRAIAAIREAIRLEPYNAGYFSVLSMILLRSGRKVEAEAAAREGLRLDPGSIMCLNNLAASLIDQGRVDDARPILLEALRLDPHAAVLHANLGTTQLHAGDRQAADETIRESLRLDPQSTETVEMLRMVETTKGPLDRFFFRLVFWWRRRHPVVRLGVALISLLGGYLTLGFALFFWALLLRDGWGWLDRQLELSHRLRGLGVLGAIVPRTPFGGALVLLWLVVALVTLLVICHAISITAAMAGCNPSRSRSSTGTASPVLASSSGSLACSPAATSSSSGSGIGTGHPRRDRGRGVGGDRGAHPPANADPRATRVAPPADPGRHRALVTPSSDPAVGGQFTHGTALGPHLAGIEYGNEPL